MRSRNGWPLEAKTGIRVSCEVGRAPRLQQQTGEVRAPFTSCHRA
jgi:hypothetical protein